MTWRARAAAVQLVRPFAVAAVTAISICFSVGIILRGEYHEDWRAVKPHAVERRC